MWKSVENLPATGPDMAVRLRKAVAFRDAAQVAQALSACSACAGDYEDPDRTATTPAVDDAEEVEELDDSTASGGHGSLESVNDERAKSNEFPAKDA